MAINGVYNNIHSGKYLKLEEDSGCITLYVVDEYGEPIKYILEIYKDGSGMYIAKHAENAGFETDEKGRIKLIGYD